jgi:ethanolamine ammonia-lyase small subunit
MAYRPRLGHDDARRNLISNIHARGILPDQAAHRIARLAEQMIRLATSGVAIKEGFGISTSSLASLTEGKPRPG